MRDLISFVSTMLPGPVRVVGFRGVEALSRPYRFEIFLTMPVEAEDDIDFAEVVGAKGQLVLDREDPKVPPFVFAGVLRDVDLMHEFGGRALLRAVLVPKLWELTLSKHSRIFTKKSVPDVIKAVLEDNGLTGSDYALNLSAGYETEEHICQYRESDFDFISRWMEREGIYYYFEHTEDGEKLILRDDKSYPAEAIGKAVRYHPQLGEDRSAGASFRSFSSRHGALPSKIKLRDYDYARPSFDISGAAPVSPNGSGEISLYGERFFTAEAGKRLARLRSEELLARQAVHQAAGTRLHLRSGHTFELEDHPRARFNAKYVATEVHHHGNQSAGDTNFQEMLGLEHEDVYFVEVSAIPETTQFRAESRTAWPRIYGFENGVVDGPAFSEYAQIDEQGRYLVKIKFDEASSRDGTASTLVRMMQPHGGSIEGFHFPLRKATEVVLSFLGGDPDRPVISGVMPNVLTPSPVTSGNHTKNVIQTGGRNRLELEDQAGAQRITLSTPYSNTYLRMGSPNAGHELIVKTDDNTLLDAGKNFDTKVGINGGGSWDIDVQDNVTTDVTAGNVTTTVHAGNDTSLIKGNIDTTSQSGNITTTTQTGKIGLVAKTDLTGDAQDGKIALTAKTTADLIAKTGKLTIDAQANEMYVHSQGPMTFKSDATRDDIITQDATITRHANLTVTTHGVINSTVLGATVDTKLGAFITFQGGFVFDMKGSASVAVTMAASFEYKLALAVEATNGFKLTVNLGGSSEHNFGVKVTNNNGAAVTVNNGATVTAKNGIDLEMRGPKFLASGVTIESLPVSIRSKALQLERSSFTVFTA